MKMKKRPLLSAVLKFTVVIAVFFTVSFAHGQSCSGRRFVHPGITYTQADLDRMKSAVAAHEEPWYSTFLALKSSSYSSVSGSVVERGSQIKEGSFNGTIGVDGRKAHDLALLYCLTGETAYAEKAVKHLNANSYYTNTSSRGTGPLDNGKINLLIEAAELLRDYPGWKEEDQQRFKDMLVYPGYSTVTDYNTLYASTDDSKNGITFYWNCYNFDSGRFGNQGLFAARALLAMGIYLDNDTIFDRAYQYLIGQQWQHFDRYQDIDYCPGPRYGSNAWGSITNDQYSFAWPTSFYVSEDDPRYQRNYGYNEQLQYYIYKNGQCQESHRDQGHTLCGISMYSNIAEICWNQGLDMYGELDNRILTGWEYNLRVNLTATDDYDDYLSDKNWTEPWRPIAFSVKEPTKEWDPRNTDLSNNIEPESADTFYQVWDRHGRTFAKQLNNEDAGDRLGISGCRMMTYAHYHVRRGIPDGQMPWLKRYCDYLFRKYGYESWGNAPNWYYEWTGWGTLTKYRKDYMVGDPVSFRSGDIRFGIHTVSDTVWAADYDWFATGGQGRSYQKNSPVEGYTDAYRPGELVETETADSRTVVCHMNNEDWLSYTFDIPVSTSHHLYIRYAAGMDAPMLTVQVDNEEIGEIFCEDTHGSFIDNVLHGITLSSGVHVVKLIVQGTDSSFKLSTLRLTSDAPSYEVQLDEGLSGATQAVQGQVVVVEGDNRVAAQSIIIYDPVVDSRIGTTVLDDRRVSFRMPDHKVEATCLRASDDGLILLCDIATTTAGAGSAFARADHPDVFSFFLPVDAGRYTKCIYTHPYKAHNYNRKNLTLVCPDGYAFSIQDNYEGPWDISGHVLPGQTNYVTIRNDHANGIDYWANSIAVKASQLTCVTFSESSPDGLKPVSIVDSRPALYRPNGLPLSSSVRHQGIVITRGKKYVIKQ